MTNQLLELKDKISKINKTTITGYVDEILGMTLSVKGISNAVSIGDRCFVHSNKGKILAEVVGIKNNKCLLLPFGTWGGVSSNNKVEVMNSADTISPSDAWIGRVINALGEPLDDKHILLNGKLKYEIKSNPPNAFKRKRVGEKLETKVKCFDIFTPVCKGQRMGIFAGSGVGKSSLLSMLAKNTNADVIVIGLVGERGREVQDFIQEDLGEEGLSKSVLVVSTGDEPPLMRRQAAWTATTIAEYFRDQGKQVLLLLDSVTRFAMAQREIGLSAGEPPTTKGYTPTVFAELPKLLERSGPGTKNQGDITGLFTVLVDGDDHNEPISDAVRGILDGHIVLDRKIAEKGRYPALNITKSVSRMLPDCHSNEEYIVMKKAKDLLSEYENMEELIKIGAYKEGTNPNLDIAIQFYNRAEIFFSQKKKEYLSSDDAFIELYKMLVNSGAELVFPEEISNE